MQEDGGGERVWVPTIPVGWVESDLVPLPLPRALGRSRAGGGTLGDQILYLKLVPNFDDDDDDGCDMIQVLPRKRSPAPKP